MTGRAFTPVFEGSSGVFVLIPHSRIFHEHGSRYF
jgi:hypothetical protein